MKKCLAPLLLCTAVFVFGIGCSSPYVAKTPPPSSYRQAPSVSSVPVQPAKAKVEVVSEPAGARIEVNNDYVGDAPITVEIPQNSGYFTQETVIRALPTEAGDYVSPSTSGLHQQQTMAAAIEQKQKETKFLPVSFLTCI